MMLCFRSPHLIFLGTLLSLFAHCGFAMEPIEDTSTLEQRLQAAKERYEDVQRRAAEWEESEKERLEQERQERENKKRQEKTKALEAKLAEANKRVDDMLARSTGVLQQTDDLIKQAEIVLKLQNEVHGGLSELEAEEIQKLQEEARIGIEELEKDVVLSASRNNSPAAPSIQQLMADLDADPELNSALSEYFKPNPDSSHEMIEHTFGAETTLTVATARPLPSSSEGDDSEDLTISRIDIPVQHDASLIEQNQEDDHVTINTTPIHIDEYREPEAPEAPQPATPVQQGSVGESTANTGQQNPPHKFEEDTLRTILNNIMEHRVPVITASTLGLVHYLYDKEIFADAIAVRSPKMKEYLHDYVLPTAREALGAHFIQLILPFLPYLKDKDIQSFATHHYLASFITTKLLGSTALYLAKMATKTEQGRKLVTHYKRLPKRTKETIEKIAPWIEFVRNMLMARALASYFVEQV